MNTRRTSRFSTLIALVFICIVSAPFAVAEGDESSAHQVAIDDSRTGTAPCGFEVQRDLEGTLRVTPHVDDSGQLVLSISNVNVRGTLTNPSNGKSMNIIWVHRNGETSFLANGSSVDVSLGLSGSIDRGYDTRNAHLTLDQPNNGADILAFTAGEADDDAWTHVCAMLV